MSRLARLLPLFVIATCAAKGKKHESEVPAPPPQGWSAEPTGGQCWYPPDWSTMGYGDRRSKHSDAIIAMVSQWRGERNDGILLHAPTVDGVEGLLLLYPDKAEQVAVTNLGYCKKALAGGGTSEWESWLASLPAQMTAGECDKPLDATLFWYLDIDQAWQGKASVCEDNVIHITASAQDLFKLSKNGTYISAAGDTTVSSSGSQDPCGTEQCHPGELLLRFTGKSGIEIIKPVGLDLTFDPPEHGVIEFMVNDATLNDNTFKVDKGMQHHTSVTYAPVGK